MTDFRDNLLDLNRFRIKKQILNENQIRDISLHSVEIPGKELDTRISKIKQSIQRINKLMEELRAVSPKK